MKVKVIKNNKLVLTIENLTYGDDIHSMLCNEGVYISRYTIEAAVISLASCLTVYMI